METLSRSFEPMDIDMSSDSANNMDISYIDLTNDDCKFTSENSNATEAHIEKIPTVKENSEKLPTNTIKTYHINKKHEESSRKNYRIILVVFVLGLSIIIAQLFNVKCAEDLNLEQLKFDLDHKLYGQSKAIEALIDALKIKDSKIIIIYGGTGVGKTYTASILMESYGYTSNLYHYTMPSFNTEFSIDFLLGLTMCKNSIFIIDDLNENDMQVKLTIKDLMDKSIHMKKSVNVILIFNCFNTGRNFDKKCDQYFHRKLLKNFEDLNGVKKIIKFNQLAEEHLIKCIENEIGHDITKNHNLGNIMKNFNVAIDGCKGVHSKMRFLNSLIN